MKRLKDRRHLRRDAHRAARLEVHQHPQRGRPADNLAVAGAHDHVLAPALDLLHVAHPGGDQKFIVAPDFGEIVDLVPGHEPHASFIEQSLSRVAQMIGVQLGGAVQPPDILSI